MIKVQMEEKYILTICCYLITFLKVFLSYLEHQEFEMCINLVNRKFEMEKSRMS